MNFQLLPQVGVHGLILPSQYLGNQFVPYPKFTQLLGRMQTQKKQTRLVKELSQSIGHHVGADMFSLQFDYGPMLLRLVLEAFRNKNGVGVELVISVLDNYDISLDMFKEHLLQIQFNPQKVDLYKDIDTQLKSKLTKVYNQKHKNTFKREKKKVIEESDSSDGGGSGDVMVTGEVMYLIN